MINLTEYSWYYCKMEDGDIQMLERGDDYFLSGDVPLLKNEVESVLAEVPSYDEWQASENYIDYLKQCISVYESKEKQHVDDAVAYNELAEENAQLKELLKECREHLITYKRDDLDKGYVIYDGSYLIDKINQVLGEE